MTERLTMSLDQIISERDTTSNRKSGFGAARGGGNNRLSRRSDPYGRGPQMSAGRLSQERPQQVHECAIKLLLNNQMMGAVIGSGGSSIKELINISGAMVHAADIELKFPGTQLRVLYITGSFEAVSLAQSLVWEMLGHITANADTQWNPSTSKNAPGKYDHVQVSCRMAIPAASAGILLGKGGATFRSIAEETGADLAINDKSEANIVGERVVSISGTVAQCMNCGAVILGKMSEQENGFAYLVNGTAYPLRMTGGAHAAEQGRKPTYQNATSRFQSPPPRQIKMYDSARNSYPPASKSLPVSTLDASASVELAVPDAFVGAILGIKGSTLDEIISVSGANVQVSNRGDFISGTSNRRVTIIGPPACCATAQMIINHKIQMEMQK